MSKIVVRKNSLSENLFLQRDGAWGEYKTAKRFASDSAAEKGATLAGIEIFGTFPVGKRRKGVHL